MGGLTSEVDRRHDAGRRRVGHLRRREHPADAPSGSRSGARPASVSRRARSTGSRASARTARRSSSWPGRAAGRLSVSSTPIPSSERRPGCPSGRRASRGCWVWTSSPPSRRRCSPASRSAPSRPRPPMSCPWPSADPASSLGADAGDALVAIIPGHRRDLAIEADIAEEVARVRGYETLPGLLPDTAMPAYRPDPHRLVDQVRDLLSGRGLTEVVTHGLIGPDDHARLGLAPADAATIRAVNPVTLGSLRAAPLAAARSACGSSSTTSASDASTSPSSSTVRCTSDAPACPARLAMIGMLLAGAARPGDLGIDQSGHGTSRTPRASWRSLAARLGPIRLRYEPAPVRPGVDHPGRTASHRGRPAGRRADGAGSGRRDPSRRCWPRMTPGRRGQCSWSWSWPAWRAWCQRSSGWGTWSDCPPWSATWAS